MPIILFIQLRTFPTNRVSVLRNHRTTIKTKEQYHQLIYQLHPQFSICPQNVSSCEKICYIAFSCLVSLISPSVYNSSIVSVDLDDLPVFKGIIDQLFYTVSLNLGLSNVSLSLNSGYAVWIAISQEWFCLLTRGYSITKVVSVKLLLYKVLVIRVFLVGDNLRLCKHPVSHQTSPTSVRIRG